MSVRSKQVCERLDVPATTLRLWSSTFEDFLSPSARASISERGTPTQRRYTDEDIALLKRVQDLLAIGLTYDAIKETIASKPTTSLALAPVASQNGHREVAVPHQPSLDLSELTTLLARSVTLQEEILTELRRRPEPVPEAPRPPFLKRLKALLS